MTDRARSQKGRCQVVFETYVEPAPLFNPTTSAPPADAFDLYFHTPISLSLIGDTYSYNQMDRELNQLLNLYAGLAAGVVTDVQRQGGYVAGGHRGRPIPARLEIAGLAHNAVPGESTMRLHLHIYVGRSAVALDTGERHSVLREKLAHAANFAWGRYLTRLVNETERVLGFVWAPLPGHTPGDREVIDPPMAEHVAGHVLPVCKGDDGPMDQILADTSWRADAAESARIIAAEHRRSG